MRASFLVVSAVVVAASASIAGQTSVNKAATPKSAKSFTPPRTPWGDPDVSGNVTNVFEASTPFERPDDFAGRRLEEVQGDELANFRGELQKRTLANFEGPLHGPDSWWQNIYDLRKGGQAWFVVDPPDGRIPPMTRGSAAAAAESGRRRQLRARRILDERLRLQSVRPVHHARPARLDDAGDLRQLVPDRSIARTGRHPVRDDSRNARDSARRPAAREPEHPARHGRRARPLGRQHARRRDDELHDSAVPTAGPTPTG